MRELEAAHPGWAHLDAAQLGAALPTGVDIGAVPALPLATAQDMPPQAGFLRGDLGIALQALRVTRADEATVQVEQADADASCATLALRVGGLVLSGTQALQGTQIWESGIDGAGTGLRHGTPIRGGADDDQPVHPTWIITANAQRGKLQDLPGGNGATLLSTYSNHRAAYTDAFTLPIAMSFQNGWATDAISDMAQDTNDAVNNDTVVNSATKVYGNTTYNGNAQTQQLALATILTGMAQNANPQNPADPTNPYNQAAAGAVTFSSTVVRSTGVTKLTDVPEHTSNDVYSVVASGMPAPAVSVADTHTLLSGNPIGGRDADGATWTMVLSDEERAFVRRIQAEQAEHIARLAAVKPVLLVQGALHARLACFVLLRFASDGALRLQDGRVELDGFDIDIDDSGWDAALGVALAATARAALADARFVKSLLHDRVADALERALVPALASVLLAVR